jgi:xanthosine utilization system XapX-like protein
MTTPEPDLKRLRLAIVFLLIGIAIELVSFVIPRPPWFALLFVFGIPFMMLGMLFYASHVWRQLKKKDVL